MVFILQTGGRSFTSLGNTYAAVSGFPLGSGDCPPSPVRTNFDVFSQLKFDEFLAFSGHYCNFVFDNHNMLLKTMERPPLYFPHFY